MGGPPAGPGGGMSDGSFIKQSVVEMARAVREREVSPVELVQAHIDRAQGVNPSVNAIVLPRYEEALEEARAAERALSNGSERGPLHGIPFTAKECIEVAGMPCCDASKIFEGNVSTQDAVVVENLRDAGAILIGKTNIPEFAFHYDSNNLIYGATLNPHDRSRSVGGSSGGEGAALASGMSAFGVGSDYGGSIRVPCHFCGVVGIKPGRDVVPYTGHFPPQHPVSITRWSMIGPMARYVEDLELLLPIFARPHLARASDIMPRSFEPATGDGLKVAVFEDDGLAPVDDACRRAVQMAAEALGEDGHEVVAERAPLQAEVREAFYAVALAETAAMLRPFIGDRVGELSPQIARVIGATDEADLGLAHYLGRMVQIAELEHVVYEWLERHPIAISPIASIPAFPVGTETLTIDGQEYEEIDLFSLSTYGNAMALPAAAVPITCADDGLPVAVQVMGRRGHEMEVLAVAKKLERAFGGWMDPDAAAAEAAGAAA
jgi:Asp-tRNA(Asn)/Glu-tRNA(Gln) amidotransferase A subunit family amidase